MKHLITLLVVLCFTLTVKAQDTWKPNPKYIHHNDSTVKSDTHQCNGTTSKGTRCKRKVSNGNYCYQHANQDTDLPYNELNIQHDVINTTTCE